MLLLKVPLEFLRGCLKQSADDKELDSKQSETSPRAICIRMPRDKQTETSKSVHIGLRQQHKGLFIKFL